MPGAGLMSADPILTDPQIHEVFCCGIRPALAE